MTNISIYLTEEQPKKLDFLVKRKLSTEEKSNRSTLVGLLIEREIERLEVAEMVADAIEIERLNLSWSEEEAQYQIMDLEKFG